jgi:hypothetical protein
MTPPTPATQHPTATEPDRSGAPRRPGLATPLNPQVLGGLVGAVGASVFVLVNRSRLADPWPAVALVLWVVALGAFAWVALLRPRVLPALERPAPWAGAVYGASVVGMLGLIAAGGAVLRGTGHADLQPSLVALAVGLHFLPFAAAFRAPVFRLLGAAVASVGAVGLVLGLLVGPSAAAGAAVVAGLVMLVLITVDAQRD